MKKFTLFLLLTLSPLLAFAEPATATIDQVVLEVLDASGARETLREEFDATILGLVGRLEESGFPQPVIAEIHVALDDWYKREIKWEELKPQFVATYKTLFTEEELVTLRDFFRTPTGKKLARKLPSLAVASVSIRQEYAKAKQESLNKSIEAILKKNQPTR